MGDQQHMPCKSCWERGTSLSLLGYLDKNLLTLDLALWNEEGFLQHELSNSQSLELWNLETNLSKEKGQAFIDRGEGVRISTIFMGLDLSLRSFHEKVANN